MMRGGLTWALAVVVLTAAGCASRPVSAPVIDRRPAPVAAPSAPAAGPAVASGYVVKRGDTLFAIALEHGLDYRELAQWNRIEDPARIREGQTLRLSAPGGQSQAATLPVSPSPADQKKEKDEPAVAVGSVSRPDGIQARPLDGTPAAGRPAQTPAPAQAGVPIKSEPKALRLPYSKENLALLSRDEQTSEPKPTAPVLAKADPQPSPRSDPNAEPGAIAFIWPAKGRVIGAFAEPANKGLDIEGKAGDPVLAAAPGRVMYTGTGIRGYGKLIVIKHDSGYNSVYAHNREILVKEGQSVARGERIAELGDSDADRPKLHFEIRKSGKPVDPMKFLEPR